MGNENKCPICNKDECAAHKEGHCVILIDNNFGDRDCPFFKTNEQVKKEKAYCMMRMANINMEG